MSDLALTTSPSSVPTAPAVTAGVEIRWLDLESAARLSGKSVGHLRRLAGSRWCGEGRARLVQEPGSKSEWQVRSDADPAFSLSIIPAPAALSPTLVSDLRQVPLATRQKAQDRARILAEWENAIAGGARMGLDRDKATALFLQSHPTKISRATLYNWSRDYKRNGLGGLLDGRAQVEANAAKSKSEEPFMRAMIDYYLTQKKLNVTTCHELATLKAQDNGWELVGARSARRMLEKFKRENAGIVAQKRYGDTYFENTIAPYHERDYSTIASNDLWNADHHEFDVFVKVGDRTNVKTGEIEPVYVRPWITAWQDMRSRKIVGWIIRASRQPSRSNLWPLILRPDRSPPPTRTEAPPSSIKHRADSPEGSHMLALSVKEGQIVMIGDAVVRITEIRHISKQIRAAVHAAPEIPVLRFDDAGKLLTGGRDAAETARVEAIVAAAIATEKRRRRWH